MKPAKGVGPIGAKGGGKGSSPPGANMKGTSLPNGGAATGKQSTKQGL